MSRASQRSHPSSTDINKKQKGWIAPPRDKLWDRIYVDVIDGEGWRGMSVNARRILDAIICYHYTYFQKENGNLQISYAGFAATGATRRCISAALRELTAAGVIEAKKGSPMNVAMRAPKLYRLPMYDGAQKRAPIDSAKRRFVFVPLDVMESPEWRGLAINARRVMDRLLIENARHQRRNNGSLRVSYGQFVDHGVGRRLVKQSIMELVKAGFLTVSQRIQDGGWSPPNVYRITFLGTLNGPRTWNPKARLPEAAKIIPLGHFREPRLGHFREPVATKKDPKQAISLDHYGELSMILCLYPQDGGEGGPTAASVWNDQPPDNFGLLTCH
jgi:hypothetical protein